MRLATLSVEERRFLCLDLLSTGELLKTMESLLISAFEGLQYTA